MFIEETVQAYTARLASGEPTPGGGSASALVVSLGIGLIEMAIQLTKGKKKFEEFSSLYEAALKELDLLRKRSIDCVDEDGEAFAAFMELYKTKPTEDMAESHGAEMEKALDRAGRVPLEAMKAGVEALYWADKLKDAINPFVKSDLVGGVELIYGALRSLILNVEINLSSLREGVYKEVLQQELSAVRSDGETLYQSLRISLYKNK